MDDGGFMDFALAAYLYLCDTNKVLLLLPNGQVMAEHPGLSILPDGNYRTIDSDACPFSLSTERNVRSLSWAGKVQQSWLLEQP